MATTLTPKRGAVGTLAQLTTTPSGGVAIPNPVTGNPIYLGGEIWTRYSTSGQASIIPTGFGYATALSYYNEDFNEFNSVHGVLLDDIQIDGFLSAFNLAGASYPYTKFRLRGVVSFAANTTGNRSVRLKDSNGQILTTILRPAHSVASNTEKIEFDTGWVPFTNYATRPAIVSVYPGQDTGANLNAGADTATPSRIEIGYRL